MACEVPRGASAGPRGGCSVRVGQDPLGHAAVAGGGGGPAVPSQPHWFTPKCTGASPGHDRTPLRLRLGEKLASASWRRRAGSASAKVLAEGAHRTPGVGGGTAAIACHPCTGTGSSPLRRPSLCWGVLACRACPRLPVAGRAAKSPVRERPQQPGCPSWAPAGRRRLPQAALKPEDQSNACPC